MLVVRRLLIVVTLMVLVFQIPAVFAVGSCSNLSLSSNPPPGIVQSGTTISFTGTANCSPGPGKFQIVILNGVYGSSDGGGSVSGSWVANSGYGSEITVHFYAYASDDQWGISPTQITANFTVVSAGQSVPDPKPSNSGGGSGIDYSRFRLGDGGLDVAGVCYAQGQNPSNDGQHAYSWGCNGVILNKDATCALVWRDRPYAKVSGGLAGWSCHNTPQQQETGPGSTSAPSNSSNQYAAARLGDGGLNMIEYCRVTGQNESNDGQHAYSWGCGGNPVSPYTICQNVWPDRPNPRVVGGLAGLSCHDSPQTVETASNNPAPSSNGGSTNNGGTNSNNGSGTSQSLPPISNCSTSFQVNGQIVSANRRNVRTGPGLSNNAFGSINSNTVATITEGPVCSDGYFWYKISNGSNTGWVAVKDSYGNTFFQTYSGNSGASGVGQDTVINYGIPIPYDQINAWANTLASKFPSKHTIAQWIYNIVDAYNFLNECKSSARVAVILIGVAIVSIPTGGTATVAATSIAAAFLANTTLMELTVEFPACYANIQDAAMDIYLRLTR